VWGGGVIGREELTAILAESGFETVHPDYPIGSFRAICAQAPGANDSTAAPARWDTAAP